MTIRRRTELTRFSKEQLGELARLVARGKIVGSLFLGEFHSQEVRWLDDGTCEVITDYSPGSFEDFFDKNGVPKAAQ